MPFIKHDNIWARNGDDFYELLRIQSARYLVEGVPTASAYHEDVPAWVPGRIGGNGEAPK